MNASESKGNNEENGVSDCSGGILRNRICGEMQGWRVSGLRWRQADMFGLCSGAAIGRQANPSDPGIGFARREDHCDCRR